MRWTAKENESKQSEAINTEPTVASVFKIYIDLAKNKKITTNENVYYSPNTIKNWEKVRDKLKAFIPTLRFSEIDLITYNDFKLWCNSQGFALNYFGDLVKSWKALMNHTYGQYLQNLIHKDHKFARKEELVDKVYLNDEEIKKIIELKLAGKHEIIRDRFILNLFTGLRISDLNTFTKDNIHEDKITDVATKNGKSVAIPLFKELKAILKNYNGDLPPRYHQNHINKEIKEICKKDGITEMIEYKEIRGGVVKHVKKPKYKLITSHTCRRSLATNLLKKTTETKAMKVLGISPKTIQRYNKISAADNAKEVLKDIEKGALVGDYSDPSDWTEAEM